MLIDFLNAKTLLLSWDTTKLFVMTYLFLCSSEFSAGIF